MKEGFFIIKISTQGAFDLSLYAVGMILSYFAILVISPGL